MVHTFCGNKLGSLPLTFLLQHSHHLNPLNESFANRKWSDMWNEMTSAQQGDMVVLMPFTADTPNIRGPEVNIWYPVFDMLNVSQGHNLVGILSLSAQWESFLLAYLPSRLEGLLVVVTNSCGQVFSFLVSGKTVSYLGPNDYHTDEYEFYQQDFQLIDGRPLVTTRSRLSDEYCPYKISVYPTDQMRVTFETSGPSTFAVGVAFIFLFTIGVFLLYDYLVERRQRFLADSARKSNAIVSALFPKIVRDRMFNDDRLAANDRRLNQFRSPLSRKSQSNIQCDDDEDAFEKKAPIADLFPHTTVMFGDIAGFTAWSSARQPAEVFTLLETLYGAFDKIANGMDVFKVETIGDCYVAVTGLPQPQKDHHLRIVSQLKLFFYGNGTVGQSHHSSFGRLPNRFDSPDTSFKRWQS